MPPPNAATGDIAVAVYPQHVETQVGEVTIGWAVASTVGTSVSWQAIVDVMDNQWKSSGLRPLACDSVTFRATRLYVLDPATALAKQIAVTANANALGTSTFGLAPIQAAPVIKKTTPVAGRSGRGRVYHPFPLVSQITFLGEMTAGYATALNAAYSAVIASLLVIDGVNNAALNAVLLHKKPLPVTFDPITLFTATGSLGTQKRRGDYGRLNP